MASPTSALLVLASASPRRSELLRAAGIAFECRTTSVDEAIHPGESPEQYVRRLAEAKAEAVPAAPGRGAVLGADTIVVIDGRILGKPADDPDARAMLRRLAGRTHEVLTGICLIWPADGTLRRVTGVERTMVEVSPLTDVEIDWYVSTGEPADKAGAYAIQGLASRFVRRIDGSYSNVVGLPMALVYDLCKEAGILIS